MNENSSIKGIIFDMDNTLFDLVEAKIFACSAVVQYLEKGNSHELFGYFRRGKHGFESTENISDYMKDSGFFSEKNFLECCSIYEKEKIRSVKLYPGVRETIQKLRSMNIMLSILTDAEMKNARPRLEKVELFDSFDSLFTYDITGWKKPSHRTFIHALDSMGLQPQETLFVGDSLVRDIVPSKQLGMLAAYAIYGDRNPEKDRDNIMERPDHVLRSFNDILDLIRNGI
ncbi:HAD family hydrolase [Methanolobus halotolerans]|uniref:Haloacid dehalogenase n=1 Tax=Methanolobus halotolerans TaxID=2052935 RepID=A0A4E0R2F6_9EURY|nr:HAD family hydrolase [Methanolobus halotolerans]TGC11583.1 haloacid dehalogenase [Methanolobus halotolerans]